MDGGHCTHLDQITVTPPDTVEGCEECMHDGTQWVHLRLCLSCGHVGCCDSSPQRHASAHAAARTTRHPLSRARESWCWCYEDEVMFEVDSNEPR